MRKPRVFYAGSSVKPIVPKNYRIDKTLGNDMKC